MRRTMRTAAGVRPARGLIWRTGMHRRRRSKISWLNATVLCLMAAGVVMAFAGRDTAAWVPPPIPAASAAPLHRAGGQVQGTGTPGWPVPRHDPGLGHGQRPPRSPRPGLPS